jgi:hypothetical protein
MSLKIYPMTGCTWEKGRFMMAEVFFCPRCCSAQGGLSGTVRGRLEPPHPGAAAPLDRRCARGLAEEGGAWSASSEATMRGGGALWSRTPVLRGGCARARAPPLPPPSPVGGPLSEGHVALAPGLEPGNFSAT